MKSLRPTDPPRLGQFTLRRRLGSGGMGEVFFGLSAAGEEAAVKVIHSHLIGADMRERFVQEVDSLKTVYGPRVATLIDADPEDEPPWLAIEYIAGDTLDALVKERGPMEPDLAAILGAALAEGLGTIHKANLLHRDLKPHNILLGRHGPKLIDFGLAVLRERESTMTATGMIVGTPAFMSPEQASGEKHLTSAADVHSLGATLLYALTGHVPYAAGNAHVMMHLLRDPAVKPDLSGVPDELGPILAAMHAHEPSDRPDLKTVTEQMVAIATADGGTAKQARDRLIVATYGGLGEPEPDPSGGSPEHEEQEPEPVEPPTALMSGPGAASGGAAPGAEAAGTLVEPPDVGWLVTELRTAYQRAAPL